jgi:hypothetical protein
MVKAGDEATYGTILDPRFDPLRAAIIDSASSVPGQTITALPAPSPATATVTRYDPGDIALELGGAVSAGSALVMSENYYPGWAATVDGRSAPTVRADFNLIGVPLPAGAKHVSLHFADHAYRRGKLITWLAVLIAAALAAAGALVERRRRAV